MKSQLAAPILPETSEQFKLGCAKALLVLPRVQNHEINRTSERGPVQSVFTDAFTLMIGSCSWGLARVPTLDPREGGQRPKFFPRFCRPASRKCCFGSPLDSSGACPTIERVSTSLISPNPIGKVYYPAITCGHKIILIHIHKTNLRVPFRLRAFPISSETPRLPDKSATSFNPLIPQAQHYCYPSAVWIELLRGYRPFILPARSNGQR